MVPGVKNAPHGRLALVGCDVNPVSWRLHATKHNKEIQRLTRVFRFVGLLLLSKWQKATMIHCKKEVDRPTRLLQFVAFVHLPLSFRSLDLFVASLLFRKGTSLCVSKNLLLRDKIWRLPWTCCLLAWHIVTPGPAMIRTVCKYSR